MEMLNICTSEDQWLNYFLRNPQSGTSFSWLRDHIRHVLADHGIDVGLAAEVSRVLGKDVEAALKARDVAADGLSQLAHLEEKSARSAMPKDTESLAAT